VVIVVPGVLVVDAPFVVVDPAWVVLVVVVVRRLVVVVDARLVDVVVDARLVDVVVVVPAQVVVVAVGPVQVMS
jgi:hypothetical protein